MKIQLEILHECHDWVSVWKPAGIFTHRTREDPAESRRANAVDMVGEALGLRPYPVHRLDRPTSGVLLFAKSPTAASRAGEAFRDRRVQKRYWALARGWLPNSTRTIADPSGHSVTEVEILARAELPIASERYPTSRFSWIEARPLTGRRHQIRRHLARSGHPVLGDSVHGDGHANRQFSSIAGASGLALCAVGLGLAGEIDVYAEPTTARSPQWDRWFSTLGISRTTMSQNLEMDRRS